MKQIERIKKWVLIGIGSVSVVLGMLGVFLPLLPTTPFLLLAAACYVRSSERFYHWLIGHKCFGHHIKNYREGHGISFRAKVIALSMLWLTIGSSIIFFVPLTSVKILLLIIASCVTIHLFRIKTLVRGQE